MNWQYVLKVVAFLLLAQLIIPINSWAAAAAPPRATIAELLENARKSDEEKGLQMAFSALQQARNYTFKKEEADALLTIGDLYFNGFNDPKAAIKAREYYTQAIASYEQLSHGPGAIDAIKGQLRCDYALGKYEETLKQAIRIEEWAKKTSNKAALQYAYRHFARIYARFLIDTHLSKKYLRQCIQLFENGEKEDDSSLDAIYSDLGSVYYSEQQYDSALYYYHQGLQIAVLQQNLPEQILLETNLGATYFKQEQIDSSLAYIHKALDKAKDRKMPDVISLNYSHLGEVYARQKRYTEAIQAFETALQQISDQDLHEQKRSIYQKLKETYRSIQDFEQALFFAEKAEALKDSSNTRQSVDKINVIKAYYELDKKEKEVQFLEKQTSSQELIRNAIIFGAALFIFFFLLLYNHINLKSKLQRHAYEQLETQRLMEEKEKSRLKEQLQFKERELASQTVFIIQKNEMLNNLQVQLSKLKVNPGTTTAKDVQQLSRAIDHHMNFESDWEKFKLHFEQVHPHFFSKLRNSFPHLNTNDNRFLSYIRMGLSTKEIAQLLGINATSVQKSRYRLKKKMNLDKEIKLIEFIEQF